MIKTLVSPNEQGSTGGDFTWTEPGELVTPENACPCSDLSCHQALIGVRTRKGTTVAVVAEVDMTEEAFIAAVMEGMTAAWGGLDGEMSKHARAVAVDTLEQADRFAVGTRVVKDPEDGWLSEWVDPFASFA